MAFKGNQKWLRAGLMRARFFRCFGICAVTAMMFVGLSAYPTRSQTGPTDYRLAAGDKILISVLGQKELSGEFLVDAGGNIQLMFVGALRVSGLSVGEVEKTITAFYSDGILNRPQVNVRVAELRPIYVLGAVRRPGSFPFRYGTTVNSAIALSGGVGSEERTGTTVAEFLGADERLRQLKQTRMMLQVRLARLEAQRDGSTQFSVDTLAVDPDAGKLDDFVQTEKEALESETSILNGQLNLLRAQKPRLEEEVAALQQQLVAEDKQVELARQQSERYDKLSNQGLTRSATQSDLKRTQARHEGDRWRITAELSHRQVVIGELDVKILDLETQFKRQVVTAIQDTRRRLQELEISIPLASEIRTSRLLQTGGIAAGDALYVARITRIVEGEAKTFDVSETTIMEPGDLVDVKLRRPDVAPPLPATKGARTSAIDPSDLSTR